MKKKIFSKLLMGAVLVASISSFVSCKDYDDDISNLQSQIDKAALKADVTALDQKLTAAAAAAKEAADKAEADAQKAQSTADNAATKAALEQAIKDINAAAEAAGKQVAADIKKVADDAAAAYAVKATEGVAAQGVADAAAAKAAADAAQKAADEAAAAAKKAQETADANDASKAYAKQVADEAQAAAVAAADAAVKAANYATKSEVEAAQAAATAAADANADAKIAAALAEIVKKYGLEEQDIKGKLSYIASFQKEFASASALKTQINGLQSEIDAVKTMGGMAEAVAKIQSYDASVSELYSAVTSVELYYASGVWGGALVNGNFKNLFFTQAIEKANVFPATPIEGEKQFTFKEGKPSVYGDSIVVRVSPVNAVLDSTMIQLVNSKGENLDDVVEVVKVRPYGVTDDELLTRAGANNGLWLIEFNLKEGKSTDDMLALTTVKKYDEGTPGYNANANDIRFAVKVNNTKENAAERGVISAYNLCMRPNTARYIWDFTVQPASAANATNVRDIYNRYTECEDDQIKTVKVAEKVWNLVKDEATGTYAFAPQTTATETNSTNRPTHVSAGWDQIINPNGSLKSTVYKDNLYYNTVSNALQLKDDRQSTRYNGTYWQAKPERLTVDVNEEINIEFDENIRIKGFYVTLDNDFALESLPSEIKAWNNYTYENVGTDANWAIDGKGQQPYLFKGNKGIIKITDEKAAGDVIGFRVYAVHLDGTLYDPDGRAFYVGVKSKVAEEVSMMNVTATPTVVAYYHNTAANYVSDFIELDVAKFADLYKASSPWKFKAWENAETNPKVPFGYNGVAVENIPASAFSELPEYTVWFYKDKDDLAPVQYNALDRDNIMDYKLIKLEINKNDLRNCVDNGTYKQTLVAEDTRTNIAVAKFSVEFTKVMPIMPVIWDDFTYEGQFLSGKNFLYYPMLTATDNWPLNLTAYWDTTDPLQMQQYQTVGVKLNRVFKPDYVGAWSFNYTPIYSYSTNKGADYKLPLTLPNTFKMYVDDAKWNATDNVWEQDIYNFTAGTDNWYTLTKDATLGDGDEFNLIEHTVKAKASKHNAYITYTYNGISTGIKDGKWYIAQNYETTDDTFKFTIQMLDPFANDGTALQATNPTSYKLETKYNASVAATYDLDLTKYEIHGQYLAASKAKPYWDTLSNMLTNGIWKISGKPWVTSSTDLSYYDVIYWDNTKVTVQQLYTGESYRPNTAAPHTIHIKLVNILGHEYEFTTGCDMARE